MKAPQRIDRSLLRTLPLPRPVEDGDKEGRGRVLVVGGAAELPGAPLLAGIAALRAGAGKLQIATRASLVAAMGVAVPEARIIGLPESAGGGIAPEAAEEIAGRADAADALLMGTGMLDPDATEALVRAVLGRTTAPAVVLDAGALPALRGEPGALRRFAGRAVLTPHAGEMATLLGVAKEEVEADPRSMAARAAETLGAVVVLATSGSGDALGVCPSKA